MRRLRYNVATSADGFIAGPNGEYDWITHDPSIDFPALIAEFDTLVMGRKTFELFNTQPLGPFAKKTIVVCSKTLRPADHPGITVLGNDVIGAIRAMKTAAGKDMWLFGGGVLFRPLLDAGLVDTIELGVMPVLLGTGIPLLPPGRRSPPMRLAECTALPSGIVRVTYALTG